MDVVKAAREWLGTPFIHQGRVKGVGVDCAGLIIGVAHELGLSDFDIDGYPRSSSDILMEQILDTEMQRLPFALAIPGDVFFFRLKSQKHLAIITETNPFYIIHAYEQKKKVVET